MTDRRAVRTGVALAVGWLVLFVAVDVAAGSTAVFVVFFAVSPLIACAVLPPRPTAAFAAVALALAAAREVLGGTSGTAQSYVRLADVALVGALAVAIAAVRVRREERLDRVLALAEAAQRAILPVLPREVAGLRLTTRYESATEEALVGGDLYDFYAGGSTVRLLVGDVRGKGLDGIAHAARVIRAFRQAAAVEPGLADVARSVNDYLLPVLGEEDFVTAVLVEVRGDGGLVLVGCGHPPPLMVSRGAVTALDSVDGMPLGLATSFHEVSARWRVGDRMLLYTDGLIEARDTAGRFLPQEAIEACLLRPDPEAALSGLIDVLDAHAQQGRTDDLALVLVDNVAVVEAVDSWDEARQSLSTAGRGGWPTSPLRRAGAGATHE